MTIAVTKANVSPQKTLLSFGYAPLLVGALLLSALLIDRGWSAGLTSGVVVALFTVLILVLERVHPHRTDWQPQLKTFGLDVLHTSVSSQLIAPLVRAGLFAGGAALGATATGDWLNIWPTHWPLIAQLVLAIPLADFGVYWAHRLMHTTMAGWRIHAVHHSPTQLYAMASARTHPINAVVAVAAQVTLLVVLGIGETALTLWMIFLAINGLLQHANVDFRMGKLGYVLTTCHVHRAHHALRDSNCNFGNMTMVWDHLFGTYRNPPELGEDVGAAGYAIPENYWSHLAVPFAIERFEQRESIEHSHSDEALHQEAPTQLSSTTH